MQRITVVLVAVATLAGVIASTAPASGQAGQEAAPIFVTDIPAGYRDWTLVSVAHEAGNLNDIRAILGNDIAVNAYREGTLPFPEGAIVGRIAWAYVSSAENNQVFGRPQSFVAGAPTAFYLQFMVKDAQKYAATGGWGYAQFDQEGKPGPELEGV
jgi:cytochrome P460